MKAIAAEGPPAADEVGVSPCRQGHGRSENGCKRARETDGRGDPAGPATPVPPLPYENSAPQVAHRARLVL
jgi:hypothetical protein